MGVDGDHKPDLALARFADPTWLHIESPGIAVDFNGSPRFGNYVQNLLDFALERWAPLNQTPQCVAPDLKHRQAHGRHYSLSHLCGIHLVTRVNAGNDHITLFQDFVGIVETAVSNDVRLRTLQNLYLYLLLHFIDLRPLPLQTIQSYSAGIESCRRMISDRYILHTHRLRSLHHFRNRVFTV